MQKRANTLNRSLILLGIVFSPYVMASNVGWQFSPSNRDPNSQFHYRLPMKFHDDITSDQDVVHMKLNKAEKHQAMAWGLGLDEERRYVALMQNRSGYFYGNQSEPNGSSSKSPGQFSLGHKATPVEVLGFNARTDTERSKYAAQDAKQQFQYLAKYLSFLSAYEQQAMRLKKALNLPIIRKFDYAKYSPYNYKPVSLKSNDNLMLFVTLSDEVRPIVSSLMASIQKDKSIHLNIYFVGAKATKEGVEAWARSQNILPSLVTSHQITLSFGQEKFASIKNHGKTPFLVLVRGGQSKAVDTGRF